MMQEQDRNALHEKKKVNFELLLLEAFKVSIKITLTCFGNKYFLRSFADKHL